MKNFYLLISVLLLQPINTQSKLGCFFYFDKEFTIYNVKNILLDKEDHKELDYKLTDKGVTVEGKILFNICKKVTIPDSCKDIKNSSVLFVSHDGSFCKNMLSSENKDLNISVLVIEHPENGLNLNQKETSFNVTLKCPDSGDADKKNPNYEITEHNNLLINSKDACGIINEPARVVSNNKYVFCAVIFAIGLVLLFLGGYKWKNIITAAGFFFGVFFILFVFWTFINYTPNNTSYIIISIIALIVGINLDILCRTFSLLSYVLIGFLGGFFISKYILVTFQFSGEQWVVYLITIGSGCVLAIICALIQEYMVAVITAILGAFFITYSFGFAINVLDNFFDLYDKIKAGENLDVAFYIFFGLFILFSLLGIFVQFKLIYKEHNKKKESEFHRENLI